MRDKQRRFKRSAWTLGGNGSSGGWQERALRAGELVSGPGWCRGDGAVVKDGYSADWADEDPAEFGGSVVANDRLTLDTHKSR